MGILTILATAVNAVLPLVLVIFLGYLLRQGGFLSESFVKTGNKLVFNVCLPCMLFINVYDIDGFGSINWGIVGYCVGMLLVLFALGFGAAVTATGMPGRRAVIWQCVFRSNFAIIGLSLAGALGGREAESMAAVISSATVPMFNILAVIALSWFDRKPGSGGMGGILTAIAKNPLILAVVLGLGCVSLRELQAALLGRTVFTIRDNLPFLYTTISNLKAIASPFALLVLGGQFTFSAVKSLRWEITVGTVWRIVLSPLLGIGCAVILSSLGLLRCGVSEYPALIAMFGSPVAVSSAVMAGSMGADEQLATQLVVWTSLLSVVTIFVQVCILMAAGLLPV